MKKIFSYIISVIALFPILLLISILLLVPIVFLISLFPNNYLPISPIWIIEGLIGILILGYGIRLSRLPIDSNSKGVYWTLFTLLIIITGILFLCFKNLLIIFIFYGLKINLKELKNIFRKVEILFVLLIYSILLLLDYTSF